MISTVRRGLTAVAALTAGAALVAGGLAGSAMASPTTRPTAAVAAPRPTPGSGGDPTITIRVGGVRTAENGPPGPPTATGLAGVTFRVRPASTGLADTCASTAAGTCTLNVAANRTYTVTQVAAPAGWFDSPALATGSGTALVSRPYNSLSVAVRNANVTIPVAAPNSDASPTARSGTWALSTNDPPLPDVCGLRIALLIDLSGSVRPNLRTYKAAARAFVESLAGTPSSIAIYTFGTVAPVPGAADATLAPVSVATKAGVDRLVDKINGLTVPASSGTNWDAGLWQIVRDNPVRHFQSTFIISDGDPTFYGPTGNGGRGNATRFTEVENGVFSANAVKEQGTSVIGVGIGTAHEGLASTDNIRAISGPSANTDYFNTDFQRLSYLLAQLALRNCAGLEITKTAAPATYDRVGQKITYTYTVSNPQFFTLRDVHVTDDRIARDIACAPSVLATGGTATCTAEYSITQGNLDAGHVTNAARATGLTPNHDAVVSRPADATVTARELPALHLVKSASPATYAAPGETIRYTYTVTDTGNVTLHGIALDDTRLGRVTCPFTTLAPGDAMTCSAAHVTTQADVDAGRIANAADVTGHPPTGRPVTDTADATADAIHHPGIALVKTAFPAEYSEPGETIRYTYTVTNTGNVTLRAVALTDDRLGAVSCPDTTLAPGELMTCTAQHVTTRADVDRGHIANTADVTGHPPAGGPVTDADRDTVRAIHAPAVQLGKSSSPGTFGAAGETITYSYPVTNTGNVTLHRIAVTDSRLGMITCPAATLAPASSMTCTAAYVTTRADLDRGDIENAAVVTGRPPAGPPVTGGASEAVPAVRLPQIDLLKSAFPVQYGAAGELITYTYTVTNTGNVTLRNIALADDRLGDVACPAAILAPGESMTCQAETTTTRADVAEGKLSNAATATADPPTGPPVTDGDTQTVYVIRHPGIAVTKTASPATYDAAGTAITYTDTVVNTGDVTLHDVTVADDRLGKVPCAASTLAPGAATTCRAWYVTTAADVSAGSILNIAVAAGRSPGGELVTANAEAIAWAVPCPVVPVTG
jgi:hypothetical protein